MTTLDTPLKRMNMIRRLARWGMSDERIARKLGVQRMAVTWCRLCLGIQSGQTENCAARRRAAGPKKIKMDYDRVLM